MNLEIIRVENLTKKFDSFVAVNNISFDVKKGETFAFLGPNGAGKSTTIKMLITLLDPSSGSAIINSFNIKNKSSDVRRSIGYVPQLISVDGTLTSSVSIRRASGANVNVTAPTASTTTELTVGS